MLAAIRGEKAAGAAALGPIPLNCRGSDVGFGAVNAGRIKCIHLKIVSAGGKSTNDIRGLGDICNRDGRGQRIHAGSVMNMVPGKAGYRGPIGVLSRWGPSQSGCSGSGCCRRRFDDNCEGTNRSAAAAVGTSNRDASGSPLIGCCGRAGQPACVGVESRPCWLTLDLECHDAPALSNRGLEQIVLTGRDAGRWRTREFDRCGARGRRGGGRSRGRRGRGSGRRGSRRRRGCGGCGRRRHADSIAAGRQQQPGDR